MTAENLKPPLGNDSIIEAIFELRFKCKEGFPADVLPGYIYSLIAKDFPTSTTTDVNQLPQEIRERDPNLRYAATQRFIGDGYIISVGPRVFTVACQRPYPLWENFKQVILQMLTHFESIGATETIERYSLRYVNVIESKDTPEEQFDTIKFESSLGGRNLKHFVTTVRTEIPIGNYINTITIQPGASVTLGKSGDIVSGLLVDIDTIQNGPIEDFWNSKEDYIERAHETETDIFFGAMTEETIRKMEPIHE